MKKACSHDYIERVPSGDWRCMGCKLVMIEPDAEVKKKASEWLAARSS